MDTPATKPPQTLVSSVLMVFAPGEWESDESTEWMRKAIRESVNTLPPHGLVISGRRTLAEHDMCLFARQLRYGTIEVLRSGQIEDSRMPINNLRQWAIGERPSPDDHRGYLAGLALSWAKVAPTRVLVLSDQRLDTTTIATMAMLTESGLAVYSRTAR